MVATRFSAIAAGLALLLSMVRAALDPGYPTDLPPCRLEDHPTENTGGYKVVDKMPRQDPPGIVPFQAYVPDSLHPEIPDIILHFGDVKVNRMNVLEVRRFNWASYDGGFKITVTYKDNLYTSHFALPPLATSDTEGLGCVAAFRNDVWGIAVARA